MKKKLLTLLAVLAVTVPVALAGGLYLGSVVFSGWMKLKAEPSVGMLYRYWQYYDRLLPDYLTAFQISAALALLIPTAVFLTVCVGMLMKPKRELHGSARFANRTEIAKHGLLKKAFNSDEAPDLLIGKYGNNYLRWSGNEFLYLAAPTRSGKGVGIVIPNCLHYRDSMVVFDPKLENFLITGGYRAAHGHVPTSAATPSIPTRT